jgi:hypothetical protein
MKLTFFTVLVVLVTLGTLVAPVLTNSDVMKLSPSQSMDLLQAIDCMKGYDPSCDVSQAQTLFRDMTGLDHTDSNMFEVRGQLMNLAGQYLSHTSWWDKITGLFTFYNIIGFLMSIVGVVFAFALVGDILKGLSMELLKIVFSRFSLYSMGFGLSYLNCFYDYRASSFNWLFIFGDYCPFFGSLLFSITFSYFVSDVLYKGDSKKIGDNSATMFFGGILWSAYNTVYHQDYMIGVLTVWLIYGMAGYGMGAIGGGYQFGYQNYDSLVRCFIISIPLVMTFVCYKIGYFQNDQLWDETLQYFQTGVLFWGTFNSCLSLLILADKDVIASTCKEGSKDRFLIMQLVLIAWYGGMLNIGTIHNISYLTNIVGTFGVFWMMDVQRMILSNWNSGHVSVYLGIILANLWALRWYIETYPEYFIF